MSRAEIVKNQLQKQSAAADEELSAVRSLPDLTEPELREHLRKFILTKYLLDLDCKEESIQRLSEMSIEKVLEMNQRELNTSDLGLGCGGTSSVYNKIILLFMAIQRDIGVTMDPTLTPEMKTVTILSETIYKLLKGEEKTP